MENEKRLIYANALMDEFRRYMVERYDREKCVSEENCKTCEKSCLWRKKVSEAPTVDAVEVSRIEEVKQAILQTFDSLIVTHRDISNSHFANSAKYLDIPESSNDYNGIYADAMEVARRFVNVLLTDLCESSSSGMRGDLNDVH